MSDGNQRARDAANALQERRSQWLAGLNELTPVEQVGDLRFKREDKFAPLGYGGINGSKLRQCIWLMHRHLQANPSCRGLLSGASVKSPQLSMGTAVAALFGLPSVHVIGASTPTSAITHENVKIAAWLGARFRMSKVAYNPALQRTVALMREDGYKRWYTLEYGIGAGTDPETIQEFHEVGGRQAQNIPDGVETIIIPAGSCNSAASILYGIAKYRPAGLRKVILFGIGPSKLDFLLGRLGMLQGRTGVMAHGLYAYGSPANGRKIALEYIDLHGTNWCSYQDERPYNYHGISFHPTYEGKVMTYWHQARERGRQIAPMDPTTLVWIVGSKPYLDPMAHALQGTFEYPVPEQVELAA